jgi:6-phosphofructokinase 1
MSKPLRIAITTGGGDAPGLNAVIRAAVLSALNLGWEAWGICRGYAGLLGEDEVVPLTRATVRGITHLGGTILGTTNRGDPFAYPVRRPDGTTVAVDRSDELVKAYEERGFDALVAIGGDGSLRIAHKLAEKGLRVVGVPKTIDNDIEGTPITFGFLSAVDVATDAIDRLHSTAQAHERVMVVEVMGRNSGWIALYSGLAGTADVVLIPEIPYSIERVCEKIMERERAGRRFAIVVAAEGAYPAGGAPFFLDPSTHLLGGIGDVLARQIAERTGKDSRAIALRHLQRGGSPTSYDRLLALRFGAAAVRCIQKGAFGCMVALDPPDVKVIPLADAVSRLKTVPLAGDEVATARAVGICFGD